MSQHIIQHAEFTVGPDGLLANTGEREYPIDGLSADKHMVAGYFDKYKEYDAEEFARQCINGFQETTDGFITFYKYQSK